MKNSQRGFIMPLLLALIAILLVGGGAYVYTQNKQVNPTVTGDTTTQVPTVATDITVTYPNGGETLEVNEQDNLPKGINFVTRWTSNNLSGTTNVYLISATDGSVCLLGSAPVKQGSFGNVLGVSFKCKNTSRLLTSGQYKIKLVADTQSPSSDLGVNDMSDNYFTLNVVSTNQAAPVVQNSNSKTAEWKTYSFPLSDYSPHFQINGPSDLQIINDNSSPFTGYVSIFTFPSTYLGLSLTKATISFRDIYRDMSPSLGDGSDTVDGQPAQSFRISGRDYFKSDQTQNLTRTIIISTGPDASIKKMSQASLSNIFKLSITASDTNDLKSVSTQNIISIFEKMIPSLGVISGGAG